MGQLTGWEIKEFVDLLNVLVSSPEKNTSSWNFTGWETPQRKHRPCKGFQNLLSQHSETNSRIVKTGGLRNKVSGTYLEKKKRDISGITKREHPPKNPPPFALVKTQQCWSLLRVGMF